MKRPKIKEKEAEDDPFKKITNIKCFNLMSHVESLRILLKTPTLC